MNLYVQSPLGFESLPEHSGLKNLFSEEQIRTYYYSLLKSAGHVPNDEKLAIYEDVDLFPHVVQYIEMIFLKYDLNKDRILDKDEALRAFPVFRLTIKDMLKEIPNGQLIPDKSLPGVFIYLLKYGRPPKGLSETLKFLSFIGDESKWDLQASRLDLGVIFNFIADSLAK